MYERLLNETEKYLEKKHEKQVSVLELWDAMVDLSEEHTFEMPDTIGDYECLIEADHRFVFVSSKINEEPEGDLDLGEEEGEYEVGEEFFDVEEMEKLGFNQNQTVSLRKRMKQHVPEDDEAVGFAPHLARAGKGDPKKDAAKHAKNSVVRSLAKKSSHPKRKK